ncbi:BTB/POZ protein [Biscogniauxia marginata]|nr:BTB/POZ protein [Biscogniauxia marginata]
MNSSQGTAPRTEKKSSMFQTSLDMTDSCKELIYSMKKLYYTGEYSDLVISCGGKYYKVHKAIVCPRSKFFAKACSGDFKEGRDGTIELPEDDPQIVNIMIYYLYHLDYDASSLMRKANDTEDELTRNIPAPQPCYPTLVVHAKVYALAEKYFLDSLKALSTQKFEKIALNYNPRSRVPEGLVESMQEVYTSTVDTDRGLRDVVIKAFHKHKALLGSAEVREVLKEIPLLTYELLMYVYQNGNW